MLWVTPSHACGQTTHVTVALQAVDHVADPELRALLADPEVRAALISGTMFPDGGYSPIVNHAYGEVSHWEPFQLALLGTIAPAGPPWEGDDARRVAFLMGLAAHGIADQAYDAAYMSRADAFDAPAPRTDSADTQTDLVYAAEVGGLPIEPRWVPYDELIPVFRSIGTDVDRPTMEAGMASLDLAIRFVDAGSQDPERVAAAHQDWPWATSHLLDPTVPGSPERLVPVVAAYWGVLWDRLHGRDVADNFVLEVWPLGETAESGDDALVSVVFGRALDEATIEAPGAVTVDAGEALVVEAWMYYRAESNVLNVRPLDGWVADAEHTLTVRAGVATFDGWSLPDDRALTFTTAPPTPSGAEPVGCGCASGLAGPWWLPVAFALRIRRRPDDPWVSGPAPTRSTPPPPRAQSHTAPRSPTRPRRSPPKPRRDATPKKSAGPS